MIPGIYVSLLIYEEKDEFAHEIELIGGIAAKSQWLSEWQKADASSALCCLALDKPFLPAALPKERSQHSLPIVEIRKLSNSLERKEEERNKICAVN